LLIISNDNDGKLECFEKALIKVNNINILDNHLVNVTVTVNDLVCKKNFSLYYSIGFLD